jgi:hypothetical protein
MISQLHADLTIHDNSDDVDMGRELGTAPDDPSPHKSSMRDIKQRHH